ncbi:MAG: Hsp70 family protein [Myxococcales bacterium]|nr:Hsp70 family protein [Myxococcales bacterium]
MSEIAIGIDLGTSNSCVAVLRDGTVEVEVLPNAYGEATTASVVALRADGTITVGNAARANIIHDPAHTISSSKRLIGRYFFSEEVKKAQAICSYQIVEGPNHSVRIEVREEVFSLPEIGAMILRELKSIAESRLNEPVTKAVITVPANFNDNQRQATKDAGQIAGIEVLRILNEPTAAALSYGFGKGLAQTVAIYDLGGGTFDISVLQIADDVFEVLSTCGDTFLGGDDFDDRLIDLLADEFLERENINLRNDPFALEKLKVAAESAKQALSVKDEVEIRIPDVISAADGGSSLSIERTLSREEFSRLVNDLIQRTFKVCDEALQQADLVTRDLDGVILVGGPTKLPMIREAVEHYFGKPPKDDVDPDQVVALGAAIHAATLVDNEHNAFLLDITPLSLKIGVAGGLAETVIERNTPVPIEQTRTFTTFQDDQESVAIRVYQGEARESEGNELLGQFEFSGFKKARRGQVPIDVTFEINADGIVNVTARDPESGQQASTSITLSSGLSDGEIRNIIEERRSDRVQLDSELVPADAEALGAVRLVSQPVTSIPETKEALAESTPAPVADPPTASAEPSDEGIASVTPQDPGITTDPEPPTDDLESDDEDFATKVDRFEEELELLPDETLEPLEMAAADDVTAITNDDDLLAMSRGPDLDPENPATQTSKTDAEPEADPDLFEDVGTDLTTLDGGGSENKD